MSTQKKTQVYSQHVFGSFYSDGAGIHTDTLKNGSDFLYLTRRDYENTADATHLDDGVWIGIPTPMSDNALDGALSRSKGPQPIQTSKLGENTLTLESRNTPAFDNVSKINLGLDTYLTIRTNFTLNSGDISSVVCALKSSDGVPWSIPWTGVPVVDKFVCESGKKFYSLTTNLLLRCDKVRPANFYFEWEVNFNTSFKTVWNFVMQYTLDMITSPYINLSILPAIGFGAQKYQAILDGLHHEEEQADETQTSIINLYPQLPIAPQEDSVTEAVTPQPPKKTKARILTRLFKRNTSKP